ncbi:MAG: hypothetical protein AAGB31_10560 [Bdellovibrio sp.]
MVRQLVVLLLFSMQVWAQNPPAESGGQDEAEAVHGPHRSLFGSVANKEFNKPLYFDQLDKGVLLPPLELEYDLQSSQGKELKLGPLVLNSQTVSFSLVSLAKLHPTVKTFPVVNPNKMSLLISWPQQLLNHGVVEMISRTGTVLWSSSFSAHERAQWQTDWERWRQESLQAGVPAQDLRAGVMTSQYGIEDVEAAKLPIKDLKESFRFCITQVEGRHSTKICSQRYGIRTSPNGYVMGRVRGDAVAPRVLLQNEEAPLKGAASVSADMPVAFYAETTTGESYEFVVVPNKLELMDIADTSNPKYLRIVAYGMQPLGRSSLLNPDQYSSFTKLIGFEATIGDPRKFWAASIAKSDPKIYLPGKGGGLFRQRLELSEIPRAQARVFLNHRTPTGTYSDSIWLEGRKRPQAHVKSEQYSVKVDEKEPSLFGWDFRAEERGKINRSYLNVEMNGKTYSSYYELYKGFPRELSGRFSAVQASSDFIVMGEVAYNHWFEDLFGWSQYWLSRQRWGLSAKYFQSFNELTVNSAGSTAPLNVLTVDLKYRAQPGLWGRDESLGALVSYQNVSFDEMRAPMLGVGAFWARSMPKVFDDFFNLAPFMRYPKWVDMEFIYYVNSMSSDVTLNSSMSLNFHGKVYWSDRYFGEAGFGVKRYGFSDSSLNQKAELNTFYGTVGLGLNF